MQLDVNCTGFRYGTSKTEVP